MATFKSSTFGKISGRYGDALATTSKATGKNYLRVASVPTNPRTEKQIVHRAKFGFSNSALRAFYPIYKVTFGGNQGIRYAINRAFKEAIVGEYPNFTIDYTQLIFTEGALYKTEVASVAKSDETNLIVEWDATILAGSHDNDLVNFILYNENSNQALMMPNVAQRSEASTTITLPTIWKGATIHCWMNFITANKSINSDSQYIDSVTL